MFRRWYYDFAYEFQKLTVDGWKGYLRGKVEAKNCNDALKKIRKKLQNREFERLVITQTGDGVKK